ncbi:HAD family acid phosphatase [Gleimia hominis]|uniref:HAD family acid phosphatase n=1 Tax=Gleimia hominis TaxID=595468 RepID=A0ABU3I893_9ACTO|nr:HAD family acid phosphatase [Gleimia hominis]MDT3766605.1 HAD family acid phosphatase [Gleimia hominis]
MSLAKVPDYCVPNLAHTGSTAIWAAGVSAILLIAGIFLLLRRRRNFGVVAAFAVLALVPMGLAAPQANAAEQAGTAKACPAGYHYDPARDNAGGVVSKPGATAPGANKPGATDPGANKPGGSKPGAGNEPGTSGPGTNKPGETPGSNPSEPPSGNDPNDKRSDADESWMKPQATYTLAADGSTGKTASGEQIINWDIAKKTVRAYYNADDKGIANKTQSPYISDVTAVVSKAAEQVADRCQAAVAAGKKPAAVFDSDDTTLFTYDMEDAYMHFMFTPDKQQAWFDGNQMPATPGMVDVVKRLSQAGCEIIGLTGRADSQKQYTVDNLAAAGYVDVQGEPAFNIDRFFTKFNKGAQMPQYLQDQGRCDMEKNKCTTVQFKAGTRQHIQEDLGYTIVGNFGDQWSDLQGGYAQQAVKLPNPSYYLPSPDLPEAEQADAAAGMAPAEYTWQVAADGSSGSVPGVTGDQVPNMDIVKATIREYYGSHLDEAGERVADLNDSQYAKESRALAKKNGEDLVKRCAAGVAKGQKPLAVFDVDDTMLLTYAMQESMDLNWSHEAEIDYLKTNYHSLPAVPGMVDVVKEAKNAGCSVAVLTGREAQLTDVTKRNLLEAGYPQFDQFVLKASSLKAELPDWVSCAQDKCTTVEYKSSVRKHFENDLGYRVVGNFGDQYSDLKGGASDRAYKVPNPAYYLP